MIKRFLFLILLLSAAGAGWSENVYVYVEKGIIDIEEPEINIFNTELLNIMEDGVMESFFEQGYIVFAANSSITTFSNDSILNQAAKSGGADLLLKVVVNYSEKENIIDINGNYVFYNLYSDSVVTEGEYNLPDDFNSSGIRIEDLFFSVGRSFTDKIFNSIKPANTGF